jgi:hypothetical protein
MSEVDRVMTLPGLQPLPSESFDEPRHEKGTPDPFLVGFDELDPACPKVRVVNRPITLI